MNPVNPINQMVAVVRAGLDAKAEQRGAMNQAEHKRMSVLQAYFDLKLAWLEGRAPTIH
jgi:hypothetical protein